MNVLGRVRRTGVAALSRVSEMMVPAATLARIRDERPWREWIDRLTAEDIADLAAAPAEVKRELFRRNVTLVEIETHAICNRVCPFCPNADGNRLRNAKRTDLAMLTRVFDELGSIGYRRQIKVARYSEPLRDPEALFACLAAARPRVPHAELAVVTNTDYLKPAMLERLREAGLDTLYMSIYLRPRERWSVELARAYNERLVARLGLVEVSRIEKPTIVRVEYKYKGVAVRSACIDFGGFGSDRGGLLERYADHDRRGPCREPFETFVVDYTGKVMPCCNLLSDRAEHRDYTVGSLMDPGASIFDVYAGGLAGWRRSMVGFGRKESPCTTCRHRDVPDASADALERRLRARAGSLGLADEGRA